ncbi:MAG TPA: family 20 glycosylhydrolase [Parasegetibacter sp.]
MNKYSGFRFLLLCLSICAMMFSAVGQSEQSVSIIPKPVSLTTKPGHFEINSATTIYYSSEELKSSAEFLQTYLKKYYNLSPSIKQGNADKGIVLTTKVIGHNIPGAYNFLSDSKIVLVQGDNKEGVFYGVQSLIQLIPPASSGKLMIPSVEILDYPRFSYRGMHLDVCRHFFPVDFVKKYIDYLALHKMNYFHWHLTDDQGWRIEIKKHPKLTQIGGCREGTLIGRYPGKGYDSIKYCGYYTQDQIRDIVKYAADRQITIVPEIEMPGHALAALAAYPELGCTGGPYATGMTWGVFDEVFCAGNENTFRLLEDVIDEVAALFPGKYIHIGGDECPKTRWKTCPKCQKRIKDHNLKDEHELQSYFIQRMEKYVNSKGKIIIGWDEILEGGLAPNATVMSWRGEEGGIEAAKQRHDVIMTPTSFCYFDYSQTINEDSITFGGYVPVEKVYGYEPIPAELTEEQGKHILGAQGNVWTEYIHYPSRVEYTIFPRLTALSEVLWSAKEARNWDDFSTRLQTMFKRYEKWNAQYSRAFYELKEAIIPAPGNNGVIWKLSSRLDNAKIVISDKKDNNTPFPGVTVTDDAVMLHVKSDGTFFGKLFEENKEKYTAKQRFSLNKATGKFIVLKNQPSSKFPGNGGAFGLVNGVISDVGMQSTEWLGWNGGDMEAIIHMDGQEYFSEVTIHALDHNPSWIYHPSALHVSVSDNGYDFTPVAATRDFQPTENFMGTMKVVFDQVKAKYLKIEVKNFGRITGDNPGSGTIGWLFLDEIIVK